MQVTPLGLEGFQVARGHTAAVLPSPGHPGLPVPHAALPERVQTPRGRPQGTL